MSSTSALRHPIRRDRTILVVSAASIVAICWLVLLSHDAGSHASHAILRPHAGSPGVAPFVAAFGMWVMMMVAMMLPPVMPWILLFASTNARREPGRAGRVGLGSTSLFVTGYFSVWALFSLVAAALQVWLSGHALLDGALSTGPVVGGLLLALAGAFQWTPWKAACLRHCRSPLGFFLAEWRDGPAGAFRMGARHGWFCTACCWALMALSFAVGVMNLLWMAVLTLLLCLEKTAPAGDRIGRLFGLVLIVWGIVLAVV